jgi:hypothetical protein
VFVVHGCLSGRKKFKLASMFWVWQLVWMLNGPAFVTIIMTLFQVHSLRLPMASKALTDPRPSCLAW